VNGAWVDSKQFPSVIMNLPALVCSINETFKIEFWNNECESVTGYSFDEMSAYDDPLTLILPEKNLAGKFKSEIVSSGVEFVNRDYSAVCKDGSSRIISWSIIPANDNLHGAIWLMGYDVTDKRIKLDTNTQALEQSRLSEKEITALLEASRIIPTSNTYTETARKIFDICKDLIGAPSGYVALLTDDGEENEVLFLEAGGRPCSVDPDLPMPIRGLREIAYRTRETVYDNDFLHSKWMKFIPQGHVKMKNVLFAPINIEDKTVGIIGLANKAGDFTPHDADLATSFGELAAVALNYAHYQDELHKEEERLRSLINSTPDIICFKDGKGRWLEANKADLELFSLCDVDYRGKTDSQLAHETLSLYRDSFLTCEKSDEVAWKAGITTRGDETIPQTNGKSKIYDVIKVPIFNENNEREGLIVLGRDITERKRAVEELRKSELHYRSLFTHMNSAFAVHSMIFDSSGNSIDYIFLNINASFEMLTGLKKEQVIGKRVTDVLPGIENDPVNWIHMYGDVVKTGKSIMFEQYNQNLKKYFQVVAYRLFEDQFACIFNDITDRKEKENIMNESLKEKTTLIRELYHRTKNNMQIICSFIQLQRFYSNSEEINSSMYEIENRIQSMALVHEKLYQSKNLSSISLKNYIEDLVNFISGSYQINRDDIIIDTDLDEIEVVLDIANPVGLMINELLTNCFKYAFPQKKGCVKIILKEETDHLLRITVMDNGVGVPSSINLKNINSLGLQIVSSIARDQLHGTIEFMTDNGFTCTVTFQNSIYTKRV
jgi:PAS domain S-box-containing protein